MALGRKKLLLLLLRVMLIDMVICCPRTPEDEELGESEGEVVYGVVFFLLRIREGLRYEPCVCTVLLVILHSSNANFYNHKT